jgi:hypothetical protein
MGDNDKKLYYFDVHRPGETPGREIVKEEDLTERHKEMLYSQLVRDFNGMPVDVQIRFVDNLKVVLEMERQRQKMHSDSDLNVEGEVKVRS